MNRMQLIAYVQDRMGEATEAEAACMVDALDMAGHITRDASGLASVDTSNIPASEWMEMLEQVSASANQSFVGTDDVTCLDCIAKGLPHASDCNVWIKEKCSCVIGGGR